LVEEKRASKSNTYGHAGLERRLNPALFVGRSSSPSVAHHCASPDVQPYHNEQIVVLPPRDWASWIYLMTGRHNVERVRVFQRKTNYSQRISPITERTLIEAVANAALGAEPPMTARLPSVKHLDPFE
jgi:hypothetical protein